ncbi:MAG: serine/threonine-protein phosphatase, partial [Spirochaetales bacterium]|nr:serine/threonine-protein phosphatase [Spirochaetales bacterium]
IQKLNNYLVRTFETEKFVTAVFLDYDEESRRIEICDMGHSHIFMFREEKMRKINTNQNNLPIGIVPDIEPRVDQFTPRGDDILFVITDGLIEQESMRGEIYSTKQISSIFSEHAQMPVEVISDRLLEDFNRFRGKRTLMDDVTWSIMRFVDQEVTL